ncbi:MAG: hypothetical protein IJF92_05280 [Bacilli bacterium]|nr:hypothetical protein [Bacilli bacterium]
MKVIINDNNYDLTNMSIMWDKEFEDYTNDDVIDLTKLKLEERYKATNKLFNNIYNDITLLVNDNLSVSDDYLIFGQKAREIDQLQKFLYDSNKIDSAIKYLEDGITYMLTFYKDLKENDEEKKR